MPIHVIFQTGITSRVGAGQVVERERRRIRQNDPVPHHLHAALPVANLAVVFAQDARTLRDQQELAHGGVIDRLRHRGDHVARKIGLDARHQCPGHHRSGHDLIRRSRQRQIAGITGFRGSGFLERLFLVLPVLHGGRVGRLGRRRGRPGRQRVEGRIGGEAWRGGHLRLRYRRGLRP